MTAAGIRIAVSGNSGAIAHGVDLWASENGIRIHTDGLAPDAAGLLALKQVGHLAAAEGIRVESGAEAACDIGHGAVVIAVSGAVAGGNKPAICPCAVDKGAAVGIAAVDQTVILLGDAAHGLGAGTAEAAGQGTAPDCAVDDCAGGMVQARNTAQIRVVTQRNDAIRHHALGDGTHIPVGDDTGSIGRAAGEYHGILHRQISDGTALPDDQEQARALVFALSIVDIQIPDGVSVSVQHTAEGILLRTDAFPRHTFHIQIRHQLEAAVGIIHIIRAGNILQLALADHIRHQHQICRRPDLKGSVFRAFSLQIQHFQRLAVVGNGHRSLRHHEADNAHALRFAVDIHGKVQFRSVGSKDFQIPSGRIQVTGDFHNLTGGCRFRHILRIKQLHDRCAEHTVAADGADGSHAVIAQPGADIVGIFQILHGPAAGIIGRQLRRRSPKPGDLFPCDIAGPAAQHLLLRQVFGLIDAVHRRDGCGIVTGKQDVFQRHLAASAIEQNPRAGAGEGQLLHDTVDHR